MTLSSLLFGVLLLGVGFTFGAMWCAGRAARRSASSSNRPPAIVGAPHTNLPSMPPPPPGFMPSAVTTPAARSVCVCGHGGQSHKQVMPHPCDYHGCDCPHFLRRLSTEAGDA
jgi:hypothetical protein